MSWQQPNQQYQQQPAYGQQQQQPYYPPPAGQQASYAAAPNAAPYQNNAQHGSYQAPPPHQPFGASAPPAPFPPNQYQAPNQNYGAPSAYPAAQPAFGAGGYAPPASQYPAQGAAGQQFAQPPQQQSFGYQQPAYGAPPANANRFVPRTYLGVPIHPSENPLLPPGEVVSPQVLVDGCDPSVIARDIDMIRKSTKGLGTKESPLIKVITSIPAVRIPPVTAAYRVAHQKDLLALLKSELSGHLEEVLMSRMRGPLGADAHWVDKAIAGLGTNEALITDLIIGRQPSSLSLLRAHFTRSKGKPFNSFILDDLSLKTRTCFEIALNAAWSDLPDLGNGPETFAGYGFGTAQSFPNEPLVQSDMRDLERAMKPGGGVEPIQLATIIFGRSPVHLNRLQQVYLQHRRSPMTRDVKKGVSGHLRNAFLYALEGGKKDVNGCWRDAKMLHKTMEGAGTKDLLLIVRLLRAHWDKARFANIQAAYYAHYGVQLREDVRKDTSGHYREALLALFNP